MLTRRELLARTLQASAAGVVAPHAAAFARQPSPAVVNDIHSQLNATRVERVEKPQTVEGLQEIVRRANRENRPISLCGGRHAMGGQQFGADTVLVDTSSLPRVVELDAARGEIEVEAGIQWPAVIDHLQAQSSATKAGNNDHRFWSIIQKQTGADRLSLGGSLSANVHGRGLRMKPIVADVAAFTLLDASGNPRRCSRQENAELFRLAIGGYGLFGPIVSVRLKLMPRKKLRRVVELIDIDEALPAFERRIAAGALYGDFQYSTDSSSPGFLRKGIFACYEPVDDATPLPAGQKELSLDEWRELLYLAHTDKARVYELYTRHYLATNGQIYTSDNHQLSAYVDDYHAALDRRLGSREKGSEMITEIYVPREKLARFMADVRVDFLKAETNVIYGTIRLIEKDDETFLPWAREAFACVIFNLHVVHTPQGLERAKQEFRQLIDRGLAHGGSFYLTYHRWATRRQMEACHPRFVAFLRQKLRHDPQERFQSDWWRHYRTMFADQLS